MKSFLAASLLLLVAVASNAQEDFVELSATTNSGSTTIDIVPSSLTTRAMLITSEPSGTALVTVIDRTWKNTQMGQVVEQQLAALNPRASVETTLPTGQPSVTIAAAPGTDTAIKLRIWGQYDTSDFLLAYADVNPQSFHFLSRISDPTQSMGQMQHCGRCDSTNCGCVVCPSARVCLSCPSCTIDCCD